MKARLPIEEITTTVRWRIVMHSGGDELVLREGKIADEFGISRTPVRQVLQALASEWMIEVRSGVGSISSKLNTEDRLRDYMAFSATLVACAACSVGTSIGGAGLELKKIKMQLEHGPDGTNETFFECAEQFVSTIAKLVADPILRSTLIAGYWRFMRWRMRENRGQVSKSSDDLSKILDDAIVAAETNDGERILKIVAIGVDKLAR
jgi:DNA-binding GntR family transcriptional regulator